MPRSEKSINCHLEAKVKTWLASIQDEAVRKLAARDVIVTGGCIVSMLLDEKIHDYDLYFRTIETVEAVAKYYVKQFNEGNSTMKAEHVASNIVPHVEVIEGRVRVQIKSAGVAGADPNATYDYFESTPESEADRFVDDVMAVVEEADKEVEIEDTEAKPKELPKFRPIFLSDNAVTLSDGIQLVIRFHGEPEEIHANYDYVHCTCYWTPGTGLVATVPALLSILTKELRYTGSLYPVCAMIRTRKFIARGWTMNAGQYIKITDQINELDLTSIAVWEDQLVGVDTAYFQQLIEILKNYGTADGKIEKSYVMKLVDRMF